MNEAFLALVPDDKAATASLLAAYFQTQNFAKTVELGEKVYAATPDKGVAYVLATSYLQLKNIEKFAPYAEKTIAEFPIEQTYSWLCRWPAFMLARKTWTRQPSMRARSWLRLETRFRPAFRKMRGIQAERLLTR